MQQYMGQHAPMAVHHYHLSICSTKQHLAQVQKNNINVDTDTRTKTHTWKRREKWDNSKKEKQDKCISQRKKTARNGHKWVDGDKQGQLHIHGLKVCWHPTCADSLTAWKQKYSLTKTTTHSRQWKLAVTHRFSSQGFCLQVANGNLTFLLLLALEDWVSARWTYPMFKICIVCYLLIIWGPDTTGNVAFQVDLRGPVSLPTDRAHQDEAITIGDKSLGPVMGPGKVTHLEGTDKKC